MEEKKETNKQKTRKRIRRLREKLPEPQKCSFCPNPLHNMLVSADTEPFEIDGKPACRDCFLRLEGEEIEKHPVGYVPHMYHKG